MKAPRQLLILALGLTLSLPVYAAGNPDSGPGGSSARSGLDSDVGRVGQFGPVQRGVYPGGSTYEARTAPTYERDSGFLVLGTFFWLFALLGVPALYGYAIWRIDRRRRRTFQDLVNGQTHVIDAPLTTELTPEEENPRHAA